MSQQPVLPSGTISDFYFFLFAPCSIKNKVVKISPLVTEGSIKNNFLILFPLKMGPSPTFLPLISESIIHPSKLNAMTLRITCIVLLIAAQVLDLRANDNAPVTLYAGTPIYLELNQEVSSANVEVGHTVELFVSSDVTVNGKVVIATGSIAEGRITKVVEACGRNCNKRCAMVSLTVESVQAVDGQRLYLRGVPLEAKGDCFSDTPAVLPLRTKVSARVLNNIKINA